MRRLRNKRGSPLTNGHTNGKLSQEQIFAQNREFLDIANDAMLTRQQLMQALIDPRRDINTECGYPIGAPTLEQCVEMIERDPIANRINSIMPMETWTENDVYESEDDEDDTPFEIDLEEVKANLRGKSWYKDSECSNPIDHYLRQADIESGKGRYGVLLFGFDDGGELSSPVPGVVDPRYPSSDRLAYVQQPLVTSDLSYLSQYGSILGTDAQYYNDPLAPTNYLQPLMGVSNPQGSRRKLLYLRAYSEKLAKIVECESNRDNPRYGQPTMYQITLSDPAKSNVGMFSGNQTVRVHWTRCLHLADTEWASSSNEILAEPRLNCPWNRIYDCYKIYSSNGEGMWLNSFPGMVFESHPQLGGDLELDEADFKQKVWDYQNHLQRFVSLIGMTAKTLPPTVVDPTSHIDAHLTAICILINVPKRVFMGSEQGELASSQDTIRWINRKKNRQARYNIPRVQIPFYDRLILAGVCRPPKEETGYRIKYIDPSVKTEQEKATIGLTRTQAMAAYVQGGVESLMGPLNYLTREMGYTDEEAQSILDDAEENAMSITGMVMKVGSQGEQPAGMDQSGQQGQTISVGGIKGSAGKPQKVDGNKLAAKSSEGK